jgi:mRNA interferase HigB
MRVVGRDLLSEFMRRHAECASSVQSWLSEVAAADWPDPARLKARHPSASLLADGRVVFNIKGNRYRLVAAIALRTQVVRVLWVGTHAEYDRKRF